MLTEKIEKAANAKRRLEVMLSLEEMNELKAKYEIVDGSFSYNGRVMYLFGRKIYHF